MPDTKDWTWVLQRQCPECGVAAPDIAPPAVAGLLRAAAQEWAQVLASPDVRQQPAAGVWSPLEYACHVRDMCRVFDGRVGRMLAEDDPLFDSWDQDATAVEDRYGEQDPSEVAGAVLRASGSLAERLDGVAGERWQRPGRRSDGAAFTIASISRYLVHDDLHHLWDVGRGDAVARLVSGDQVAP